VRRRLEDSDFARRLEAVDRELAESAAGGGGSVIRPSSRREEIDAELPNFFKH